MEDINEQEKECPVKRTINLFQGKWNLRIIYELSKQEALRFGALKRAIPNNFKYRFNFNPKRARKSRPCSTQTIQ